MFISRKRVRTFKKAFNNAIYGGITLFHHGFFLPALLLPWYIWTLLFFPELILWWLVISLSVFFIGLCFIKERSVLYWIIPCIFLFNNIQIFKIPWPYVKLSYIGALSICFAASFKKSDSVFDENNYKIFSFDFQLFFMSMVIAAVLGILSYLSFDIPASVLELKMQIRIAPFIDQTNNFISVRYLWLWICGVAFYWAIFRFIKKNKDIYLLFWVMQICSIFVAAFGIYSYITKKYMLDFYFYERRICSTFSSPAVLADITTVVLIIGVFLFKSSRSLFQKIVLIGIIMLNLVVLFLSGCRANIIILLLFGVIWLLIFAVKVLVRRRWKTLAFIFGSILLGLILLYQVEKIPMLKNTPFIERIIYWKNTIKRNHKFVSTLLEGRKWHWKCGFKMVKSSPLWGIGSGHFEQDYIRFKSTEDMFSVARAHNVLLRIFAENGFITGLLYLTFIISVFFKLGRGFSKNNIKIFPEESKILQVIFISFAALFLLSMFSDIILVREECIFFISILAACATRMYKRIPSIEIQKFILSERFLKHTERKIQLFFKYIGWNYFGNVKLVTLAKVSGFTVLLILFMIGMSEIKWQRLKGKQICYGFYNKVPDRKRIYKWQSIGTDAAFLSVVKQNIFYFGYRAVNKRMSLLGQFLKVYINGELTVEVPLNSLKERWVYCDVSGLYNQNILIEYKTDKVFVPLKEKWFADTYAYGAVVTKPIWIKKHNYKNILKKREGILIEKWKK